MFPSVTCIPKRTLSPTAITIHRSKAVLVMQFLFVCMFFLRSVFGVLCSCFMYMNKPLSGAFEGLCSVTALWKHAYSNIFKISPPKTGTFQIKNLIFSYFCSKNIDCGFSLEPPQQGGSNEYPQSMFLSRKKKKKNNVYPCKPQFYYIKMEFKGVKII